MKLSFISAIDTGALLDGVSAATPGFLPRRKP
jgi:hypothetical protein